MLPKGEIQCSGRKDTRGQSASMVRRSACMAFFVLLLCGPVSILEPILPCGVFRTPEHNFLLVLTESFSSGSCIKNIVSSSVVFFLVRIPFACLTEPRGEDTTLGSY